MITVTPSLESALHDKNIVSGKINMAAGLHISINAEKVFDIAGVSISNSILTTWIVLVLILFIAAKTYNAFKNVKTTDKPTRFQSLMELIIEALFNLVKSTAGDNKKARAFFPIVSTFFLFIILSNWIGLLPGVGSIGYREKEEAIAQEHTTAENAVDEHEVESTHEEADTQLHQEEQDSHAPAVVDSHQVEESNHGEEVKGDTHETTTADHETDSTHSGDQEHHSAFVPYFRGPTADLNTTLALAVTSIILVQFVGFRFLGFNYSHKFFNLSGPIDFFVGFLEFFSEISKIISFAFRLFGNIFAGEVLLGVIAFLMPLFAPLPFLGLEIFVGFIQALVFSMLTLVFMNIATISHSGDEH